MKIYEEDGIKLYNGDCLEVMDELIKEDIQFDAIITDPPYGTVKGIGDSDNIKHGMVGKTQWDESLDPKMLFVKSEKLLREKGSLILFSQEPYTSNLMINQHDNLPFSYRLIWEKDHFANSLIAKKAPVSYYEDICIFFRKYDIYNENPLRNYFFKIMQYTNKKLKQINSDLGHRRAEHSFYIDSTQFKLCTEKTYKELTNIYELENMKGFLQYGNLLEINKKYKPTFNLGVGKKYKSNILKYKKDYNGYHPTQKPLSLMEDLIKTYTNEGDLVLDFTMGSGTTGVACKKLGRKFIGVELDEKYFDISVDRIKSVEYN